LTIEEKIDDPNMKPPFLRASFNGFLHGLTTIFIVLIGDDWNTVMYAHVRDTSSIAILFFVSLVIFGNFIMLNLFLAILLKNFEVKEEEEKEIPKKKKKNTGPGILKKTYRRFMICLKINKPTDFENTDNTLSQHSRSPTASNNTKENTQTKLILF
jgi:hypothetical protein